jgi:hypothetical protein
LIFSDFIRHFRLLVLPHQRKGVDFSDAFGCDLRSFFERGFQYEIDSRFQNAEALMDALKPLESGPSVPGETAIALSNQVRQFTHQIVKEVGDAVYYTETGRRGRSQAGRSKSSRWL